jgi:hypothetical protein
MFKIYGVTDPENPSKKQPASHVVHEQHTTHDDHHHNIDVAIHDEVDHETDIGQIAVDILDTTSSIIIGAPIA